MSTAILTNRTTSGASDGIQIYGEAAIFVRGVLDGAIVEIESALTDVPANYVPCGGLSADRSDAAAFTRPGVVVVNISASQYWIRAVVHRAGPKTNITVETDYGA